MIEWSTERKPVRFVTNIASMGVIDHFRQHCRLTEPEFGNPNSAWELGWLMGLIRQEAGGDLIAAAVVATDLSGGETLAILNNALITERDGTWWIEPDAFSPEHVVLTSGGQPQEAVEELLQEKGWLRPGDGSEAGSSEAGSSEPDAKPDIEPDAGTGDSPAQAAVEAKSVPPPAADPPVMPAEPDPAPADVAPPASAPVPPPPEAPAPEVTPQPRAGSAPGVTPLAAAAMPEAAAVPEPGRAEPSDAAGDTQAEDHDADADAEPSAKSRRGHLRLVTGSDDEPAASSAGPAGTAEPQVEPQPAGAEAFQPPAPAGPAPSAPGPVPSGPAPAGPAPAGPARPGQGRPDPGRFQPPGRQDPARVDPFQPTRPDPARFQPPGRADPRRASPARSDPAARAPGRAGAPGNLDPIRLEDPIPWIEPPDWGEAPRRGDQGSARPQPAPGQPTLLPRQPPTAAPAPEEEEPESDASVPWSDLVNSPPPDGGRGKSRSFLARRATQRRP